MYEKFSLAPDSTNLLTWWQTHEKILPILSNVAKIVLTIPCSSAKSERVFSCAGNFATPKRNRLGLKKLEDLVVFYENDLTSTLIDFEDFWYTFPDPTLVDCGLFIY